MQIRMKTVLRALYQPYKYIVFLPFLVVTTVLMGTLAVVSAAVISPRFASLCGVLWARLNSWVTPMAVVCRGKENISAGQSYVVVSNHQSQYDIFVLYGWLGIDFKWVMKKELRRVPVLGYSCAKIGHIFIDRSNREAALASLKAARRKVAGGTSVLFFPEGTRSPDGRMLAFKKGAFKMAVSLDLPLLPVTIQGTRDILPTRTIDLFPGRVVMTVHPPIDVSRYGEERLAALVADTRRVIASGL
jgi:1-acyl-sn-glycerol-3-phosphate acyltransferase